MPPFHFAIEAGPLILECGEQCLQRRLVSLCGLGLLKSPIQIVVENRRRRFLPSEGKAALMCAGYELQHHLTAVAVRVHTVIVDGQPTLRADRKCQRRGKRKDLAVTNHGRVAPKDFGRKVRLQTAGVTVLDLLLFDSQQEFIKIFSSGFIQLPHKSLGKANRDRRILAADRSINGPSFGIQHKIDRYGSRIRPCICWNALKVNMETSAAGIVANPQFDGPALACPCALVQQQDMRPRGWIVKQSGHVRTVLDFGFSS